MQRLSIFAALFVTAYTIANILTNLFQCVPIKAAWDPTVSARCIEYKAQLVAIAIINVTTDVVVLVLPMRLVWGLQISPSQKWRLSAIFSLGGLWVFNLTYNHSSRKYSINRQRLRYQSCPTVLYSQNRLRWFNMYILWMAMINLLYWSNVRGRCREWRTVIARMLYWHYCCLPTDLQTSSPSNHQRNHGPPTPAFKFPENNSDWELLNFIQQFFSRTFHSPETRWWWLREHCKFLRSNLTRWNHMPDALSVEKRWSALSLYATN